MCSIFIHISGFPWQAGRQNCRNKEGVGRGKMCSCACAWHSSEKCWHPKGINAPQRQHCTAQLLLLEVFHSINLGKQGRKYPASALPYERALIQGSRPHQSSQQKTRILKDQAGESTEAGIMWECSWSSCWAHHHPCHRAGSLLGMWRSKACSSAWAPQLTAGELVTASLLHNNLNQIPSRSKQKLT